ncbi:ABC transporter substrate-binding protein [Clostridium botulinum]|uniref:ABC transporter substrate-binding protein n=1 Tax=Clostridium botulinum TaxID=1491 RepID=A0A9Q1UXT5_CLOBO|nr:ABC transporter substrate-binding protein [Clostridium botulinum]AEB77575.1 ABC transporter, substrate-binding protein [Clostridium botulinum BKT015925]KEH95979.1 ABC transporter, substrate-binding protein [Clostridium botulinum C/D str. Sp77]KLU74566.1 ABC transporter substrate-binding protein [Clostridium botulinum V891]KOA73577.1 ABC transporter substrate-binding protein [Clostridium botulinum]KOA82135.1 ABC transporter substrate-binding protein [Clostridium botulinum]
MKFKVRASIIIFTIIVFVVLGIACFKSNIDISLPNLKSAHLVVYSCLRSEETQSILELFKEKTNCSYEYIQLPTQEAVLRIEDEMFNPKADIFLSGTCDSLNSLSKIKAIKSYKSQNQRNIPMDFRLSNGKWSAFEIHPFSIVINKEIWNKEFKTKNISLPKNFKDLTNINFKGKIALPNPLTSGTGHSFICYLYNSLGDKEFKRVVTKIKGNTGLLSTRGYNVVQNVASGEYPIGVSYLNNIKLMEKSTSDLIVITPNNTGIDIHGVGIINKVKNTKASKAFVDFILSDETQKKLQDFSTSIPVKNYIPYNDKYIIPNLEETTSLIELWKNL